MRKTAAIASENACQQCTTAELSITLGLVRIGTLPFIRQDSGCVTQHNRPTASCCRFPALPLSFSAACRGKSGQRGVQYASRYASLVAASRLAITLTT